jgi:hypothetical protein
VGASYGLVVVVVALVVLLSQFMLSTASQVSVRFKIASDVNVTKYNVGVLAGYPYSLAAFVRDGVLYIAYDNLANGSNIVRVDTGEIVKVCSFSDYVYFDSIVAGKGTAYGVMNYWDPSTSVWGTKIIDLWNCRVLVVFENATSYFTRYNDWFFRYDMYADKLLYGFIFYNESARADLNYVALVDVDTGDVKELFLGVRYSFINGKWYVDLLGLYVGSDYYYIATMDFTNNTYAMHIYYKNLEYVVSTVPWENTENVAVWYGSSDLAINAYGVLQHKYVQSGGEGDGWADYWFKLVMHDALFSNATEYVTDADSVAANLGGVMAYRDLFVFHNGKSAYSAGWFSVPYAFMLLPNIGLAVNTSIAGFAIPVDYELWSKNRVVLFNPATGDVYIVDPPTATYTTTITETSTTPVVFTETVATTITVTTTMSPPSSPTISPLLLLLSPFMVFIAIILIAKAIAKASRYILDALQRPMAFVKKKHAHSE